ncbi:MAG TPA: response regulator [Burkholderiales bacterium]|jgi:CheY-like chemotaxis protein|nr:response regulator [Burkholderiales bacterium]
MQTAIKPRASKRVLIIDDDIDAAHTLFMLLLEMGHAPAYATSGRAAIAQATKLRPEFVFLDIGLPDLDGSEVAKQLRQTGGCEHALIIAVTGLGNEHRERMLQAGCDAYYVKPLDPKLIETFLSG